MQDSIRQYIFEMWALVTSEPMLVAIIVASLLFVAFTEVMVRRADKEAAK